jgi:glucosamine--fructose-6-phosphate aminotransferase (isomerizing)
MCGIVGYIGGREAKPILLNALKKMEYRGYDSAGIAILNNTIEIFKKEGKIQNLEKILPEIDGSIGIGHTRWATHGRPSNANAHPHRDCTGSFAIVHNGVLENFMELKKKLCNDGHKFVSQTDTEVIAHLIEKNYTGNLEDAVRKTIKEIHGSYALCVISDKDEKIVCARMESPLVIGVGEGEYFVASDIPALLEYTDRFIYLEDGEIAVLTRNSIEVTDNSGTVKEKKITTVTWSPKDAEKAGYEHFMLKEIHETPKIITEALRGRVSEMVPLTNLSELNISDKDLAKLSRIVMVACGTSYHACLIGKHIIERIAKIPVQVEIASECRYETQLFNGDTLVIAVSQSGETADTLAALKKIKGLAVKTLAMTNVLGSSITRIVDSTMLCRAGPEISVAATKSFTAQLILFYILGIHLGLVRYELSSDDAQELIIALKSLSQHAQQILNNTDNLITCACDLARSEDMFYVGRNISHPVALEGALKMKEISYVHAEGYPAGELKHGPFALLSKDTPAIAITPRDHTYKIMLSNIVEMMSRDAKVIAIADEGDGNIDEYCTASIKIPEVKPIFLPVLSSLVLQLLAYYTAKLRGCPIDHPKNLAKSVTVE